MQVRQGLIFQIIHPHFDSFPGPHRLYFVYPIIGSSQIPPTAKFGFNDPVAGMQTLKWFAIIIKSLNFVENDK
jgi:hypothetical protein